MADIELLHIDCMEYMKDCSDNAFDLAIVDPPYGIGIDGQKESKKKGVQIRKAHDFKGWDNTIPPKEYFEELKRVSKNQIIWGGNYFIKYLEPTKAWIFWYKEQQGLTMSDGELAWTSLNKVTRMYALHRTHLWQERPIHPTQKPVRLYIWILSQYANKGDLILDTHLGSASSAIACYSSMFDMVGCEIDEDYYNAAVERYKKQTSQRNLLEML